VGLIIDQDDPFVVLYGVSWGMYEQLLEALGEYHLRHTYADGTLEMRGVLYGVAWMDYQRFLSALGDYNLRHTYDGWHLEMMPPRKDHNWIKSLIGRMIELLTYEFGIPIQSVGSTTLTADEVTQGVQPDEAYYIAHEPSVRGKRTYNSAIDPPPDLIVEVDVTKSSLERMPTFALLKIPEVWRHGKNQTKFFQLQADGTYLEVEQSIAFPFLRSADIQRVLDQSGQVEENALLRSFVAWAKQQRDSPSS
jgi:Uma2 family endonuclease